MKPIPLTGGKTAWVDDADYPALSCFSWYCLKSGYAARGARRSLGENRGTIYMHRQIAEPGNGMDVDHINGDRLLNIRENLRVVSHGSNMLNRGVQKNSLSGHKGIRWEASRKKWSARIGLNRKTVFRARFSTLEEAIAARAAAVQRYHGEFGRQTWDEPAAA